MDYERTVGDTLLRARKRQGLSQADLGRMIGTDQNAVSRYERGQTPVPLPRATKIAEALELDSQELIMRIATEMADEATVRVQRLDRFEQLLDRFAGVVADLRAVVPHSDPKRRRI